MLKKLLLNNKFIALIIVLNTFILFLDAFDNIEHTYPILYQLDILINIIFILEMAVKLSLLGWHRYIKSDWNKIDFVINMFLLYMFLTSFSENVSFIVMFRLFRIVKFLRFIKYVPNVGHLIIGLKRALKASLFVIILFFIYLITISFVSCYLFKHVAPEYFANPLISVYSSFKIFTVEGWDVICENTAKHFSSTNYVLTKLYFMMIVLSGGIFGLSIVNAIFVDEMIADNNDELNNKIDNLINKVEELKNKLNESN